MWRATTSSSPQMVESNWWTSVRTIAAEKGDLYYRKRILIWFKDLFYISVTYKVDGEQRCVRWEMGSRTQMQRLGFLIIMINKWTTKTTPKGKNRQAGRQAGSQAEDWSTVKHETHVQTQGDYIGRQTRGTRETQLEPLKQWLSKKMGGDRQSTWEHMAPTNNMPCAYVLFGCLYFFPHYVSVA